MQVMAADAGAGEDAHTTAGQESGATGGVVVKEIYRIIGSSPISFTFWRSA